MAGPFLNLPANIPPASFTSVNAFCAVNTAVGQVLNGINVHSVALVPPNGKATIRFRAPFRPEIGQFSIEGFTGNGTPWLHGATLIGTPGSEVAAVVVSFWEVVDPATGQAVARLPDVFWVASFRHGDGIAAPIPTT